MRWFARDARGALVLLALWPWALLFPAAEPFGPVSYTHLRAHETVLDLVCRLLLEKKKPLAQVHATSS